MTNISHYAKLQHQKPLARIYSQINPNHFPNGAVELSTTVDNYPPARIGANNAHPALGYMLQDVNSVHSNNEICKGSKPNNTGEKPEE